MILITAVQPSGTWLIIWLLLIRVILRADGCLPVHMLVLVSFEETRKVSNYYNLSVSLIFFVSKLKPTLLIP